MRQAQIVLNINLYVAIKRSLFVPYVKVEWKEQCYRPFAQLMGVINPRYICSLHPARQIHQIQIQIHQICIQKQQIQKNTSNTVVMTSFNITLHIIAWLVDNNDGLDVGDYENYLCW